jgi:ABC-type xylose transport system permease subunit
VSPGGQSNLLSVLTTTYLPPVPSYLLGAVVIGLLGLSALRSHRRACQEAAVQAKTPPDGELAFLRWLLAAQALALVVLTCGQFRGLPLPLLILATGGGGGAGGDAAHPAGTSAVRDWRQ